MPVAGRVEVVQGSKPGNVRVGMDVKGNEPKQRVVTSEDVCVCPTLTSMNKCICTF